MSKGASKPDFLDWVVAHPRNALQLGFSMLVGIWQLPVMFVGVLLHVVLTRWLRLPWWWVLLGGFGIAVLTLLGMEMHRHFHAPLATFIPETAARNWVLCKVFLAQGFGAALEYIYDVLLTLLLGFSLLVAGILAMLDLIPNSRHEREMRALQRGERLTSLGSESRQVRSFKPLTGSLSQLRETDYDGTLLGLSVLNRQVVVVPDVAVNQLVLVLGTTGGGKTVSLRRFYQRALSQGYPLIIVDGKPTEENVEWVTELAQSYRRPFYGFNCGNFYGYDCLAQGGYTELKDKIISLKDTWESDYYRSIAEDYLQTTFEVLIRCGEPFDLKTVVDCLDYAELALKVRKLTDERLMARVRRLEAYERKDITGLQAHLNLLIHSELGHYFDGKADYRFSLPEVMRNQGVVYFALPALRFPSFSKVLGKLVINDIKTVIDSATYGRVFTVFDEFSVFAGEQVLNLVNMGRGKGIHAVFGTQGLADLEAVAPTFANQVLNCVNTVLCHRLNDQGSAETIASWVGTRDGFDITAQISQVQGGGTGMGSVRRNKSFIVHPDEIKQGLQPGEAFYITKVERFHWDKILVKYA